MGRGTEARGKCVLKGICQDSYSGTCSGAVTQASFSSLPRPPIPSIQAANIIYLLPGQRSVSENSSKKEKLLSLVAANALVTKGLVRSKRPHWSQEREVKTQQKEMDLIEISVQGVKINITYVLRVVNKAIMTKEYDQGFMK